MGTSLTFDQQAARFAAQHSNPVFDPRATKEELDGLLALSPEQFAAAVKSTEPDAGLFPRKLPTSEPRQRQVD
jgi:hypothetical protein